MEKPLSELPNLGPKSEDMLRRAGITSVAQLRAIGSVQAYLSVRRTNARASLNLLWALEGALTDQHWRQVARADRLRLLLQIEAEDSLEQPESR